MSGTYSIISKVSHPSKFACYVKFNEDLDANFYSAEKYPNGGEYWECDSLDPSEIAVALQSTADNNAADEEAIAAVSAQAEAIVIKNGKIDL